MQSAWEKMTGGLCNNNFADKPRKELSARQVKDRARSSAGKARQLFSKLDALNGEGADGRTAKRKLNDKWYDRGGSSTTGFFNQKTARAIKRGDFA